MTRSLLNPNLIAQQSEKLQLQGNLVEIQVQKNLCTYVIYIYSFSLQRKRRFYDLTETYTQSYCYPLKVISDRTMSSSKKNYNYPTITIAMSSSKIFFSNFVCLNFATLLPHLLCLISAIIEQNVNRITRRNVLKMFLKCSYLAKTQNGHITFF